MFIPKGITQRGKNIASSIVAYVHAGASATSLYNKIKGTAFGYRKQTFLNDFRQFRIAKEGWDAVKRLPANTRIAPEYFVKPQHTIVDTRYAYVYHGQVKDIATGKLHDWYQTIGTDILDTKADLIQRIEDANKKQCDLIAEQLLTSEIVQTFRGNKL